MVTASLPRRAQPSAARLPVMRLLVALALVVGFGAGCGSDQPADGAAAADGPRVAHPRFDGDFVVTEVELDGAGQALIQPPTIEIDAQFGGLTVQPGCNTYFGSFTLDEDGSASFTVTGGSDIDCGEFADQEEAVLAALDGATNWTTTDSGFRFDGPASSISAEGATPLRR